jgi:hypothetical protein
MFSSKLFTITTLLAFLLLAAVVALQVMEFLAYGG